MMIATGYVRTFDKLGRFVIPKKTRKLLGISKLQPLEIFVKDQQIRIEKYTEKCKFCGSKNIQEIFKKVYICKKCSSDLRRSDNYEILKNDFNLKIIK